MPGMTQIAWREAWDAAGGARRAQAGFAKVFGGDPMGVWAAPGRVNLIGEHVDYNAGACLPLALPHRTYVALRPRTDGLIRLASAQVDEPWEARLDEVAPGTVSGWGSYVAGVAWSLRAAGVGVPDGFDAFVDSCVPFGAGLSSSAALECAVGVALDEVSGAGWAADDAGRARLASACVRAENEIAQAPTGGMDQAAALRCRAGHALLLDTRDGTVEQVPFDLAAVGLELLVIDTRARHANADGQYGARRRACEAAAQLLGVGSLRDVADAHDLAAALDRLRAAGRADLVPPVRHVVTEIERTARFAALLREGRVREVGPLLDASHASLRDDYAVSCTELDVAVEAARAAGALGARMTGGGFGGSAIALVPSGTAETAETVAGQVVAAFASAGFAEAPSFLVAQPAASASRVG